VPRTVFTPVKPIQCFVDSSICSSTNNPDITAQSTLAEQFNRKPQQ